MASDDASLVDLCDTWIRSRQHIGPKHLTEPAPDEATLRAEVLALQQALGVSPGEGA
jgi:hypothetical protein